MYTPSLPQGQNTPLVPKPVLAFLLCLLGICINCLIIGPGALTIASHGQNDFRLFYTGGKLAGSEGLYNMSRVLAAQREAFGEASEKLMPVRLPFYYALLSPLARLPYKLALSVWTGSNILAIIFFVLLSPGEDRIPLAIACCWSLPLVFSLAMGQDLGFLLLLLVASLRLLRAQKRWLAGLVLSLCLIKFHLFLLLPLLFLGRREWRLAAGFCSGTVFLLIVSFATLRNWPQSYFSLIMDPAVSPGLGLMPNLHGLTTYLPGREVMEVLLSLAVVALVWRVVRGANFELAWAATLLGSLLLTRHVYLQDCAILVGPLVTIFRSTSNLLARNCAFVLLLPLSYVFIFIQRGSVTAILFLLLLAGIAWSGFRDRYVRNGSSQVSEAGR